MLLMPSAIRQATSAGGDRAFLLRNVLSRQRLQAAVTRERARADRSGQSFCLVTFRLPGVRRPSRALWRLARTIRQRARATDEIGWLDESSVAALLPDTNVTGARHFAGVICGLLGRRVQAPRCRVESYPNQRPVEVASEDGPPDSGLPDLEEPTETQAAGATSRPLINALVAQPLPWGKRALDLAIAGPGLLLLLPLLGLIAVAIKVSSPGPVIFNQVRAGLEGRPFRMHKFRTMVVDAEARKQTLMHLNEQDGPAFKLTNDPRVTPIGRLLRRTSLDELPQLLNVLKGEMSLVGPRPLPMAEAAGCTSWQRRRVDITPGLTCTWQTMQQSTVRFDEWMRMDLRYAQRRSPVEDLRLLLATTLSVVLRRHHG